MRKWSALIVAFSAVAALLVGTAPARNGSAPVQAQPIDLADARVRL